MHESEGECSVGSKATKSSRLTASGSALVFAVSCSAVACLSWLLSLTYHRCSCPAATNSLTAFHSFRQLQPVSLSLRNSSSPHSPMTDSAQPAVVTPAETAHNTEAGGGRRKRKRTNNAASEGSVADTERPVALAQSEEGGEESTVDAPTAEGGEDGGAAASGARRRYIVFVGNLPYRSTVADVEKLFSAMRPVGCRLPTDRDNRKPKGFAFVEFDDATCMRVSQPTHPIFSASHA